MLPARALPPATLMTATVRFASLVAAVTCCGSAPSGAAGLDRTVLPIPEPARQPSAELDARNATPPPRFEVKAPEGAPNVLLVLIDDLGFAGTSAFGGPVATPTFDRLAGQGLCYNNFHTTAVCSPTFLNIKNKSMTITAEVEVPEGTVAHGTLLAQGGRFGGWSLYVKDGIPGYHYNYVAMEQTTIAGAEKLPAGRHTIRFEFAYDGGGPGKGGAGTLFVDGRQVAEGRIPHTQAMVFSADETADVGIDLATPVVEAIGSERKSRFTGRIPKITVEVK